MTRILFVLLFVSVLCACNQKGDSGYAASAPRERTMAHAANRFLAYEHELGLETQEQQVAGAFEAAQAACREAAAEACVVLESRISTGRHAAASLKFRAAPAGIRKLIAAIGKQGEITNQSTTAEDLAGPIEDGAKKLEMLNDYRAKLQGLLGRAAADVDALIKLNRELAQVQSDIEALSGQQARLTQRVQTELLRVSIHPLSHRAFWRPIGDALSDFGTNLSQGISTAITGIAYLLPWGLVLLVLVWALRKLWRRRQLKRTAV